MKKKPFELFVVERCIDILVVYFWVKHEEKTNSMASQANLIPHAYTITMLHCCSNNLPHEHCNNLPQGDFSI